MWDAFTAARRVRRRRFLLTLLYQSGIWWLRSALKLRYGQQHLPTPVRDTLAKKERPDSHVWMPTANGSHGRCRSFGIWKKDGLAYTAKYGFRKDFGWTLFFKSWVRVLGFFSSSPPLPSLLFIISVSVYTQTNLFVCTALTHSIPERFLWPGTGSQARPCASHVRYTGMQKPQSPSDARGQLPAKVHRNSSTLAYGRVSSSPSATFLTT